ncbi:uncharacterized protein LOC105210627 [Zeugodacus cucurbitae]|uniref:uncharacterized protein LOC105210627 n=1 Tax=Zeugodacus cucurbitae TaxID=28588 RepID=UPI0023D93CB8|nr:uncharacterized protein LOC105210627 [Zeugodacus cucurbitae]
MLKVVSVFCLAFKATIMEYLKNTSLSGFHLLHFISHRKYQRIFWSCFLMAGIISALYVTFVSVRNILEQPTVTTLESNQYSIEKVPFSAVAVCSVNKFSRSAVNAFVEELRNKSGFQISQQLLLQKMKLFGGLFDTGSVDFKEAASFQREFLDKYNIKIKDTLVKVRYKNAVNLLKNTSRRVVSVVPSIISETPKRERKTYVIDFCFFLIYNNYLFIPQSTDGLKYIEGIGVEQGLTLLLNTSKADYFFTDRSFAGFTMQFFNFGDFPDSSIGGTVQEAFIPRGGAIDLRLSVFSQTATSEMRLYDVKRRLCFLFGENVDSEDENYSTDKCMTRCKAHGMLRLCGCVPYYIPSDFLGRSENNFTYCTLAHLECLYRNRVTLNTYSLLEHRTVSNRSLQCAHCLPLCNFNFYNFRRLTNLLRDVYQRPENVAFIKLIGRQGSDDKFNYTYDSLITLIKETEDLSIVKIYFDSLYAVLFSKRSLYTWYEILSNIGGVIGIFMGCSLVSAFEVIYFFIIKLINKMRKYY